MSFGSIRVWQSTSYGQQLVSYFYIYYSLNFYNIFKMFFFSFVCRIIRVSISPSHLSLSSLLFFATSSNLLSLFHRSSPSNLFYSFITISYLINNFCFYRWSTQQSRWIVDAALINYDYLCIVIIIHGPCLCILSDVLVHLLLRFLFINMFCKTVNID